MLGLDPLAMLGLAISKIQPNPTALPLEARQSLAGLSIHFFV